MNAEVFWQYKKDYGPKITIEEFIELINRPENQNNSNRKLKIYA